MYDPLSDGQIDTLIRAFIDIDTDDPGEDEAFGRMVALFNRVYAMGQQHERERVAPYHAQHRDDPDEWEETAQIVTPQLSYVRRARR